MVKNELLNLLKKETGNNRLRFPEGIEMSVSDNCLSLILADNVLSENMQKDCSAFEAWAICLKSILPEKIHDVLISWVIPSYADIRLSEYNRLIYRAVRFEQNYNWVKLKMPEDEHTNNILTELRNNLWVLNYPTKEAETNAKKGSEATLERNILHKLQRLFPDAVTNQQLPVGLFNNRIEKGYERTPGQNSQIDLWSLRQGVFTAYELKKDDNVHVGIISEIMFYVNVISDLAHGVIKYPEKAKNAFRDVNKLYTQVEHKEIKTVKATLLTHVLHPLITTKQEAVLSILCNNRRGIIYEHQDPTLL